MKYQIGFWVAVAALIINIVGDPAAFANSFLVVFGAIWEFGAALLDPAFDTLGNINQDANLGGN